MAWTWKWNGQQVYHPLAKLGVVAALVVLVPLTIVTTPITVPIHFALKRLGRKGFVRHQENGSIQFVLDTSGFQKA